MNMALRCRETYVQSAGDLLIAELAPEQLGDLALAPGERRRRRERIAAGASSASVREAPE
jgi:hypothetical protein